MQLIIVTGADRPEIICKVLGQHPNSLILVVDLFGGETLDMMEAKLRDFFGDNENPTFSKVLPVRASPLDFLEAYPEDKDAASRKLDLVVICSTIELSDLALENASKLRAKEVQIEG